MKTIYANRNPDNNINIKTRIGMENVKASYIGSPNLIIEENIRFGIKTKYVMMH